MSNEVVVGIFAFACIALIIEIFIVCCENPKKKHNKWIWILIAVIAVSGLRAQAMAIREAEEHARRQTRAIYATPTATIAPQPTTFEEAYFSPENVEKRKAYERGYDAGKESGYDDGYATGYEEGYDEGKQAGYDAGYEEGYDDGVLWVQQTYDYEGRFW